MAMRWDVLREPMLFGGVVAGRDGGEREDAIRGRLSPNGVGLQIEVWRA